MKEIFDIKIIRLKTGEDLIAFCFEDFKFNRIVVKHPKTFYPSIDIDSGIEELIVVDWMPKDAFPIQEVSFSRDHVLFTTYASKGFGYRYLDEILDEVEPGSDLSDRIKQTIEEAIVPDGETVH
jgi:hypothetical protein